MTIDAARIYPDRALSYEFDPLDDINESYIEEESDYQGGEWIVPQVRVVAAHGYQASIYLFPGHTAETVEGQTAETVEGQTAETVEPWQALSPSSGLVQVRVTASGHVVVSAETVRALGLAPGDEIEVQIRPPRTRRSMRGLVAGRINVSESDLAEIRSEMWRDFPKDPPK